jgi:copper(I)-binding protein
LNRTWIGALAVGLLSFSATAAQDKAAQPTVNIQLQNAWVRAMPPSQAMTAAYLTVVNKGAATVDISGATSDIARSVEIHTTREVDGYMRMQQLSGFALAPGESLELAPGGTHLMLLGVTAMPAPGEAVELCLVVASGDQVCTQAKTHRTAPAPSDQ